MEEYTQLMIVTDEQLSNVWGNANFGNVSKRDVIKFALLKSNCGYYNGHTAQQIITELGLVGKNNTPTSKGKKYLWAVFGNNKF